jgi:RecQ-mediated genome instability protein 1
MTLSADGIVVQVLDITDITSSLGDSLERLEMTERGEAMRGREVIRIVPGENDNENPGASGEARGGGRSMHKLLVEDAAGRRVWGFELTPVTGVKVGMNIGAKILLRGCTVARGVILMTAGTATVMGGKVEALQKAWVDGRKETLKSGIENLKRGN